jgi:2'-5' RNA ligase
VKLWQLISSHALIENKASKTDKSGVFITLPKEIAKYYDQKKEDESKQHITILYIGEVSSKNKELYKKAVKDAVKKIGKVGECEIGKKKYMENEEEQTIAYNPIKCKALERLRKNIIENCKDMDLEIQDAF